MGTGQGYSCEVVYPPPKPHKNLLPRIVSPRCSDGTCSVDRVTGCLFIWQVESPERRYPFLLPQGWWRKKVIPATHWAKLLMQEPLSHLEQARTLCRNINYFTREERKRRFLAK